jgi:hypothetical protein
MERATTALPTLRPQIAVDYDGILHGVRQLLHMTEGEKSLKRTQTVTNSGLFRTGISPTFSTRN